MKTLFLTLLVPGVALAVPTTVMHQGRLLDAQGGPISGTVPLQVDLWASQSGGASLWSGQSSVVVHDGYYAVVLGQAPMPPLDAQVLRGEDVWMSIAANGAPPTARAPLGSVPYALVAASVSGGSVDASEVRINGSVVLNNEGHNTTPTPSFCAHNSDGPDRSSTGAFIAQVEVFEFGGDNYSTTTGRFTAPYNGVYAFSWAAYTNHPAGRTFVNSTRGVVIQSYENGKGINASVALTAGEQVWLSGQGAYPMTWYGSGGHNLFCGHLVHHT